jgi:hypothetical protein
MEEDPKERILDLYEGLKDVCFQGIYRGTAQLVHPDGGDPITYHRVEVVSTHVQSKMSAIVGCDPDGYVWKGINGNVFWCLQLDGVSSPTVGSRNSFTISHVTYSEQSISFDNKIYNECVNILINNNDNDNNNA